MLGWFVQLGVLSRLACSILAARDAYRSVKRINEQAVIDAYAALQSG